MKLADNPTNNKPLLFLQNFNIKNHVIIEE
jgi:hypothetical protein